MSVIRSAGLPLAFAVVLAWENPATAFDFVDSLRVYDEDYEGETSFPLSPESNELGASGLSYWLDPIAAASTLTGSSLEVSLATVWDGDRWVSVGTVFSEVPPGVIGFDSYGVRGHFANATGRGVDYVVGVYFDPGASPFISARLITDRSSPDPLGTIVLIENGPSSGVSLESVPAGLTAAILAGASFSLDLAIERAVPRAEVRLEVSGSPPFALTAPLGETANLELFGYPSSEPHS